MTEPSKRIILVGRDSVGCPPKEFSDNADVAKMEYCIHNFANREEKRGEYFFTGTINAHGHPWKLKIYPRGHTKSKTDTEHVSMFLVYAGENTKIKSVVAKAIIRTKAINIEIPKFEFSIECKNSSRGFYDFSERKDVIQHDCNDAGTLTITVELQVATEKRSVWFPQFTYCDNIGTHLFGSTKASDVLFTVGNMGKEFVGHTCILALRAEPLYELVLVEEESSSSKNSDDDENSDSTKIVLPDVDEKVFEILLEFVYTGKEPNLNDESTARSVLLAADRFGVMELKLYMESIIIEKFLVPLKAAGLLLFADSYSCGLLKEAAMSMYITDSIAVMDYKDDWIKLQESSKLLTELLVYATSGRKRYSSVVDDGNGTLDDVDGFDVTSLRERLQKADHLDMDGSREILVERWKNYLRSSSTTTNNTDTSSSSSSSSSSWNTRRRRKPNGYQW
jgi:hypothetical protein